MFLSRQVEEGQQVLAQRVLALIKGVILLPVGLVVGKKQSVLLNPQLFSYFNNVSKNSDDLSRVFFGYLKSKDAKFIVHTNEQGMIDLPNYGYLFTKAKNKKLEFVSSAGNIKLKDGEQEIQYKFEPIIYIKATNIEIRKYSHPFYKNLLKKTERVGKQKLKSEFHVSIEKNIEDYLHVIEDSLALIKKNSSSQYKEIVRLCRTIVLLKGSNLIAFTAFDMHGVVFLRPRKSDSRLFFAEHIIHETSHIALNSVLLNIQDFFTVDPFKEMFSSPFRKDLRGAYQVIQAAFVLAKIAQFFSELIVKTKLRGKERYEAIGRFMLSLERLKEALSYISNKNIYTDRGEKIFNEMNGLEQKLRRKHSDLFKKYVVLNQKIEFDLEGFLELNKIIHKDAE